MASPSSPDSQVPNGQLNPSSTWGEYNNLLFVIQQALGKMQTATLVRVDACSNGGELSPVGLVDITPMVNQIDALGNPTEHVTIFNVPYFRMQGGSSAIIIDPVPGDIGIAVFANRDISKVKSTKARANPGSLRQFSYSDAMYLGGCLNGTPTQYVQFSEAGITIHSPTLVALSAPSVTITAPIVSVVATTSVTVTTPIFTINGVFAQTGGGSSTFSGNISTTGNVISQGTNLHTHVHTSSTPGNPTSPPL